MISTGRDTWVDLCLMKNFSWSYIVVYSGDTQYYLIEDENFNRTYAIKFDDDIVRILPAREFEDNVFENLMNNGEKREWRKDLVKLANELMEFSNEK